jgi:hypothetical protein
VSVDGQQKEDDELRAWFHRQLDGKTASLQFDRDAWGKRMQAAHSQRVPKSRWAWVAAAALTGALLAFGLVWSRPRSLAGPGQTASAMAAMPAIPSGVVRLRIVELEPARRTATVTNPRLIDKVATVLNGARRLNPGVYHCPLARSTVHEVLSFTYGPGAGDAVTVNWVDAGCSVFTVSRGATGPTPVPGRVGQKTAVYLAPANLSSILAPLWSGQQP